MGWMEACPITIQSFFSRALVEGRWVSCCCVVGGCPPGGGGPAPGQFMSAAALRWVGKQFPG